MPERQEGTDSYQSRGKPHPWKINKQFPIDRLLKVPAAPQERYLFVRIDQCIELSLKMGTFCRIVAQSNCPLVRLDGFFELA